MVKTAAKKREERLEALKTIQKYHDEECSFLDLSKAVKQLRKNQPQNTSQRKFAEYTGISFSYIALIESGKEERNVKKPTIMKIIKSFDEEGLVKINTHNDITELLSPEKTLKHGITPNEITILISSFSNTKGNHTFEELLKFLLLLRRGKAVNSQTFFNYFRN